MLSAQPPVHSPLGVAALLAGARAAVGGGRTARGRVERLLGELYQPKGVLLTDSGTTALHLALRLGVAERPGPVALPAYCCYDVATAADAARTDFILYDLDPATLGPDWTSLRRAFDQGARVVVAVHLYGIPVDLSAIHALAGEPGVLIVEDAAQAAGARLGCMPAGSVGQYAILSFGRGKGITGGRGGALLANTVEAAERLAVAASMIGGQSSGGRDLAILAGQWVLGRPSLYGLPLRMPFLRLGETIYRAPEPPRAPSNAALGTLTRTLTLASAEAERRRSNAGRILAQIGDQPGIATPRPPVSAVPGFLRLPVVVDATIAPALRSGLARQLGVWPGYPQSLADLPGFGSRRLDAAQQPSGARLLADQLFTLPTHSLLDKASLYDLEEFVARACRGDR